MIKKTKVKAKPNSNERGLGGRTKAGPSKAHSTQKGTGALAARSPVKKPASAKPALKPPPPGFPLPFNPATVTNLANPVGITRREPQPQPAPPPPGSLALSDVSTKLRIQAIVRDFATQQPPPGAWGDWILVTASKYELSVDQVEHCLERLMSGFQAEVKSNLHEEALSIAKQIGNLRGKALKVLDDGLDAYKEVYPAPDKDGNIGLPILVKDHAVRGKFYDRVERLFGMAAPSKAELDIHDVDRWGSLSDEELRKIGGGIFKGMIEISRERKAQAELEAANPKAKDTVLDASFEKTT